MTVSTNSLDKLGLQQLSPSASAQSGSGGGGFDQLLEGISAKPTQVPEKNTVPNKTEKNQKNTQQENKPKVTDKKNVKSTDHQKNPVESTQTQESQTAESSAPPVENTQSGEETESVDTEMLKDNIIAKVAEALEIPQEVLSQILAVLNLQPEDLLDKSNLTLIVMALAEVEEPAELLNIPGVSDMLKGMEQAVEEAVILTENNVAVQPEIVKAEAPQVKLEAEVKTESTFTKSVSEEQPVEQYFDLVTQTAEESFSGTTGGETETGSQHTGAKTEGTVVETPLTEQPLQADVEFEGNVFFNDVELETSTISSHLARNEALRSVDTQEVISQIVDKIKVDIKTDVSEIKLNLRPEHLGDVSLKITTENGIITAQFVAESQRIKEIIEANFNQLEDALSEQGINVSELSVSVQQDNTERQMQEFLQGQAKSAARINQIINGIEEEEAAEAEMADQAKIYNNTVNYKI